MELRKLIRTTIDTARGRTQVADVATQVIAQLSDDEREVALQVAVVELVRQEFGQTRHRDDGPAGRPPGYSPKVARIREHWKLRLEAWYTTTAGERAPLADLTRDEVLHNVAVREGMARANLAEAAELRRVAELMAEHAVDRVGDLPDDALRDALDRDAA